jgi:putative salt-induced outer membrane protein YdiY
MRSGFRGAIAPLPVVVVMLAGTTSSVIAEIDLPAASVTSLVSAATPASAFNADDAKPAAAPAAPPEINANSLGDDFRNFFHGWKGGVELGVNGSEGNTENLNARAGVTMERKGAIMDNKASLTYNRATSNSQTTANRFVADLRNDYKFAKGSPWRVFTHGSYENDDFQQWQHRITLDAGIGYGFIENETTTLIGRLGLGATKKIGGGSENKWTPEAIIGGDFSHKINERQKIFATVDLRPSLDPTGPYRVDAKAGWELLVDPDTKMSLKVGVEDRYDSNPGSGKKRNDFQYFAMLVWSF